MLDNRFLLGKDMKRKIGIIIVAALAMMGAVVSVPKKANAEAMCVLSSTAKTADDGTTIVGADAAGIKKCAQMLKDDGITCEAGKTEECKDKIRGRITQKDSQASFMVSGFIESVAGEMMGSNNDPETDYNKGKCTSLLPGSWCDKENGEGIMDIVRFVIGILTGAVVVAGTIGIIICGVMIVTARDDEQQLTKAKRRLLDIVIGIIAWAMIAVILNLFIPETKETIDSQVKTSVQSGGRA